MERNEPQLVAYYTSTLSQHQQIRLYASFLENITDNEERKLALQYAQDAELNVKSITKQVVENIRNKPEDVKEFTASLQVRILSSLVLLSIDWFFGYIFIETLNSVVFID